MQHLFSTSLLIALLVVTGCTRKAEPEAEASAKASSSAHADEHADEHADFVTLSDKQIQTAGIELGPVKRDFAGAIDAPGVIVADPQRSAAVGSSVGGRVIEVRKSLGEVVTRGDVLAVIDSREIAQFAADAAIAQRQRELAEANYQREARLFAEKVSSRQEYDVAKSALEEARTRLGLAQQQLRSAGAGEDPSGRLRIVAPISGVVTYRQVNLGDVIEGNAKLFEVADLGNLSVELSLSPADAGRLSVGSHVDISAENRTASGRISQLSRVLDPATRQVRALASLPDTKASWRVGETVRASIALSSAPGAGGVAVPRTAVQTMEDKPTVFVREQEGFAIRHVVLGGTAGGYVTVRSGLNGSEQIAISNTYVLKAEQGKSEAGDHHD